MFAIDLISIKNCKNPKIIIKIHLKKWQVKIFQEQFIVSLLQYNLKKQHIDNFV